jgi:hypothetical protein
VSGIYLAGCGVFRSILQILRRQVRQDRLIDLVLAECRLILFEAKAPQPSFDVHNVDPNFGAMRTAFAGGSARVAMNSRR